MGFTIGFGLSGSTGQWYLPGTDPSALPEPPTGAPGPVAGAIETVLTDPLAEGPLHGGRVAFSGDSDAPAGLVFDVTGAWNSVKNAVVVSDEAQRVTLSGFVHANVTLGGGGDSFVLLLGAKRGNVVTAGGDDLVVVEAATNLFGWVNEFRIATGDGDDTVVVRPLDIAWAATSDATFAATANGAGAFAADDAATSSVVTLGAGDDRFLGEGLSADWVDGGSGDDMLSAGRGDDTLTGGAGDDLFVLAAGDGQNSVLDFTVGADRLLVLGLDADGAAAMLAAAVQDGADAVLDIDGGGSVRLVGVAAADLSLGDIL